MKKLKLYESPPQAAVGKEEPSPVDRECTRCSFHEKAKTVCMPADGEPGGLLLIGEMPGKIEDSIGRPMVGVSGKYLRGLLKQWWTGPMAFDNAVRCAPGLVEVKPKHIAACRTYGAQIFAEARPRRVICLGGAAIQSVLNRRPAVTSVRRGYGWFIDMKENFVPVFYLVNPAYALRNRFVQRAFESDLKWALTCEIPKPDFLRSFTYLVHTSHEAKKVQIDLATDEPITYDVETCGQMGNPDFKIVSVTFWGWTSDYGYTFTEESLQKPKVKKIIKKILESMDIVAQNGKFDDRASMLHFGANVEHPLVDTRLMRKMLEPDTQANLEVLSEFVGMGGHKEEAKEETAAVCKELRRQANPPSEFTPKGKRRKIVPPKFPVPELTLEQLKIGAEPMAFAFGFINKTIRYRYNARDTLGTRNYAKKVYPRFQQSPEIQLMWKEVVRDANKAIRWIEHWGIAVDKPAIKEFAKYCQLKNKQAYVEIEKHAPGINPNSPPQIAQLLFKKLGLPSIALTDSGAESTNKDVLEALKGKHPMIEHLITFRKYGKLDSTYATGMLAHVRMDGRIHPSFLLDGTETGRLSGREPNLQNIPRPKASKENPDAFMARNIFVAPKGYELIEADFSQLELRIAAMLSQDKVMIEDFKKGIDIHANGAELCCEIAWGIKLADWKKMTKDERDPYRSQIKTSIFGKLYGKTNKSMAADFGVNVSVINTITEKIWGRYHRLSRWTDECVTETRRTGEAWTWWNGHKGRRRPIWRIADQDDGSRVHGEHASYNTPVQGTAAEFATASLYPLVDWVLEECVPAKLVLTVHDSIMFEAHKSVVTEVRDKMKEVMTGHRVDHGIPIVVDFKRGEKWGEMEDWK